MKKILDQIQELRSNYNLFSPEHSFIGEIEFWMKDVVRNSFAEENLNLIEGHLYCYSNKEDSNKNIISSLDKIIKEAYKSLLIK